MYHQLLRNDKEAASDKRIAQEEMWAPSCYLNVSAATKLMAGFSYGKL